MINKKNVLGKVPDELGTKDAIHIAIVAVRAGALIEPGQSCKINEHGEAVPDAKGVGVADPFRRGNITTGRSFWLILNQDVIPNVQHVWEHPTISFNPPVREVKYNRTLQEAANAYGVTYDQLMEAAQYVVTHYKSAKHPATPVEPGDDYYFEKWDFWSEWASETGYEFENTGSACCPEYEYPSCDLFTS